MAKAFIMKLNGIQPSQLYINSEKLSRVMKAFDPDRIETLKPIPIKKLEGEVIYTDGHTRALAAFTSGLREIRAFWDDDELDWEAYGICVEWCKKEGIRTIADLKNRIVAKQDYEVLWLDRCKKMQEDLEEKRKRNSLKRDQKPG